jgi:branched-subunit amino acid ABC-type transport system permease component
VNPELVLIAVTIIAGVVAGIAGMLIGIDSEVSPLIGFIMLIPIIAATIVGGVGDPRGAVVAGFGIGILQELSVFIPGVTTSYKPAIALLIVILGIAFKPEGLFGTATRV